ncbi:MAG TPA: FtsX-like permease family protein [Burkholderiales bacterium]|nr:FtsX-like permease family protein [Burkholderiales bacterium]
MNVLMLGWRMLLRDTRAGELHLLAAALLIAVASVTTVGFFTDRVERALNGEANNLLGADLALVSDHPIDAAFAGEAARRGLTTARTTRFPSMVLAGGHSALAELKAVSAGYPLRGVLRSAQQPFGPEREMSAIPPPGAVWADLRLLGALGLRVGDTIEVGNLRLRIDAVVTQEPDTTLNVFALGPRFLMNAADLPATGLIQPGSRVVYRLLLAGAPAAIEDYRAWAAGRIGAGQRIEGVREARPEIRSALERAERFLGLAALVSVVLASVAVLLATRRHLQRHLDGCAMMRCLGASQAMIVRLHLVQFALLGCVASALGCCIGFAAQQVLIAWLGSLLAATVPQPGLAPVLQGMATGVLLLGGFALPPLTALGNVPTLRVLRRDLGVPRGAGLLGYALGAAAVCGLILWRAGDLRLGGYALGGFGALVLGGAASGWVLIRLLGAARPGAGVSWRFGIASLRRRTFASIVQSVTLALGIMALLTLTLVRGDLLTSWRANLPPDAPNRFMLGVQPDQLRAVAAYFAASGGTVPEFLPMVRGRLIAINDRGVSSSSYRDERAKRLVDREFNLSWAALPRADNAIVAGRWWSAQEAGQPLVSVERGLAETLGIKLGDVLTYDIGGADWQARVTSLRRVEWDSFRVNFFVIAPPGVLESYPASYIASFHESARDAGRLDRLLQRFPNVLVIDIGNLLMQVQRVMDQVAAAVQFVFLFTLAAGAIVLGIALSASQDERIYEAAVMRALGANRRQIVAAHLAEFAAIGALAGVLAAAGASALGWVLATRVLNLPYAFNASVWAFGLAGGMSVVTLAGALATRRVLAAAPLASLRALA